MEININTDAQEAILKTLDQRTDPEAFRIKRYLEMKDLSRTNESPLFEIAEKVKQVPALSGFDLITIPEVISTEILFDLFDFAPDHVARSKSDTYYIDEQHVLRTHDTVFWYYYLNDPEVRNRIANNETLGALCHGKVYRKDEIDRKHMNIFHQMGGWYLQSDSMGIMPLESLKEVLREIVEHVFGKDTEYRFLDDTFPYTDPSLQIEVMINGQWLEIMGGGMPKKSVLKKLGLEGYNGWAFGFGLERLAIIGMELPDIRLLWSEDERVQKQLKLGQKYKEVSKFPPVIRDISFIVDTTSFSPNDYFDLVRDVIGDMAEEMALIDEYENAEKFGAGKKSYAYRITYRSLDRTLTDTEVSELHKKLEQETVRLYNATIR
jgi:phenylalanyl-tRNA synthetase alpha chain